MSGSFNKELNNHIESRIEHLVQYLDHVVVMISSSDT